MRRERSLSEKVFGTREFFRTLSYREFITAFSLSLLLFAWIAVLQYLAHYDWYTDYATILFIMLVAIIFILNHVFYRREHRRANNFIGRNFADYLLFFITWLVVEVAYVVRTGEVDTFRL